MAKIHIDSATNEQLEKTVYNMYGLNPIESISDCAKMIIDHKINILFKPDGQAECFIGYNSSMVEKSLNIAACKALLWSAYPDGMIDIM